MMSTTAVEQVIAQIRVSYKCQIIGKQVAGLPFYITGYHCDIMTW